LTRLQADWPVLQREFLDQSCSENRVVATRYPLAESHHNGRSGVALTFGSGIQLVYKPRDLSAEQAVCEVLDWLNERGAPLRLYCPRVLTRAEYGWMEHVPHQPCLDRAQVRRFYTRAGMLLAVTYALRATDCHNENLIARGEHPVIV